MKRHLVIAITLVAIIASGCASLTNQNDLAKEFAQLQNNNTDIPYRASYTKKFELINTKLEIKFDWENQFLLGKATLDLKPHFYETDSLILDGKGMDIEHLFLVKDSSQKKLSFKNDSSKIRIGLGKRYTRNDTLRIEIKYIAKPNLLSSDGSFAIQDDKGLYFINPTEKNPHQPRQIWTQGETEASSCWFPTIDAPNQKTTQEIFIEIPAHFKSLSNGKLIGSVKVNDSLKVDHWKQEKAHAPYLFMLGVGDFTIIKDSWNDVPVEYYVEPKDSANARAVFGKSPEMINFFSERLGVKYPWDKFDQIVVRNFVSGAMENTGATVYRYKVLRNQRQLLDKDYEDVIAHELFHQWFGDLVTCESWSNLALNESFATYGEYLWKEHKYGKLAAERHLYLDFLHYLNDEPWTSIVNFYYDDKEDMLNRHTYEKGALVLHQLRKQIGDDAFFTSLKLYLEKHAFKSAEIHDLRLAFEEVTGLDLNEYFNQWFLNSGHPQLKISLSQVGEKVTLGVTQEQASFGSPVFNFPLELKLYFENSTEVKSFDVDEKSEVFRFESLDSIHAITLNSDKGTLAELIHDYTAEEALLLFSLSENYRDKITALKSINGDSSAVAWEILDQAHKDSLDAFRRIALSFFAERPDSSGDDYKERLINSFKFDTASVVRAEAIKQLSRKFSSDSNLIEFYKIALKDSSYLVIRKGLNALEKLKREDALLQAANLENEDDFALQLEIARIYSELEDDSKMSFYERIIEASDGYERFSMLEYYKQYLKNLSQKSMGKGLLKIADWAKYDSHRDLREDAGLHVQSLYKEHLKRLEDIEKDIADRKSSSKGKSDYDLKMLEEKREELLLRKVEIQKVINEIVSGEKNQRVLDNWKNEDFVLLEIEEVEVAKEDSENVESDGTEKQ